MGKITEKLRKLGLTVNGVEPTGETISETIDSIADDYTGGSGATYTAGNGIAITNGNVINANIKAIETSNITGLTTEQCEALNVGDVVIKLTSNQKHTYTVSYKEAGVGICLTYTDASVSETVSYDFVDNAWVYNSTDVTPLGGGSSAKLYQHFIVANVYIEADDVEYDLMFNYYSTSNTKLTTMEQIINLLKSRCNEENNLSQTNGLNIGVFYIGNLKYANNLFKGFSVDNDYIYLYSDGENSELTLRITDNTSTTHTIVDTVVEI